MFLNFFDLNFNYIFMNVGDRGSFSSPRSEHSDGGGGFGGGGGGFNKGGFQNRFVRE